MSYKNEEFVQNKYIINRNEYKQFNLYFNMSLELNFIIVYKLLLGRSSNNIYILLFIK